MTEVLSVVITLVVTTVITMLKPEWLIGWLLNLLDSKLQKNANAVSNSLGLKMTEIGAYAIKFHPDSEAVTQAADEIQKQADIIKNELKNPL
jgi:hypothetical protein